MPAKLNILVSGMIAADTHVGGATWAALQYVLGLRELGHRVCVVEQVPAGKPRSDEAEQAEYFKQVCERFDLRDAGMLWGASTETAGLSRDDLRRFAERADLLVNLSGLLTERALFDPIPRRLYVDLDPGFTQLWHVHGHDVRLAGHTHFATVGLSIGQENCAVPTLDRRWVATPPPVVLTHWPPADPPPRGAPLTTIGQWRGYGVIEHDGVFYGQRAHSFRTFMSLPGHVNEDFAPALAIHPGETGDLAALAANGWRVQDPGAVSGSPDDYARFVRTSKAELGVAKSGYVAADCGWFSDRSACYLASGRPVIAQDTGFARHFPTGQGLMSFRTIDDAAAAIESLNREYDAHAHAARQLAVEWLDSAKVLSSLLERIGATA